MAIDDCRYDAKTALPVEGSVIDADDDLVELCSRIQQGESRRCAILFCEGPPPEVPPSARPPVVVLAPSRALTH